MKVRKLLLTIGMPLVLLLLSLSTFAQARTITGRVTDPSGRGIGGVSVTVKGSTTGTVTGESGDYTLTVPANATTLVFSSVGYAPIEMSIGANNTLNVSLQSTAANLNEVVVIGYGTARRRDLTGSVAAVTSKDFVKGLVTTPEQLIAGKVAGVQITPNNGAPGSGSRIRVRGGASLNASNDPLIVIDGVPVDNGRIDGAPNPLSMINPNDIESFNILKDASAAAIYGARGANGVIIITTKKGTSGKLRVNFSTLNSISQRTEDVDVLTAEELRTFVNQYGSATDKALLGTANTNWQNEIYRSAFSTDNNIALSGGLPGLPYRFSLGYLNQNGILKHNNLQRYSAALNLNPRLLDNHLNLNANAKFSYSKNIFSNQGAIGSAVYFDPTKPIMSGKTQYGGFWEWESGNPPSLITGALNPVGLLEMRDDKSDVNRFIGNLQADYRFHFLPDLRANVNVGMDHSFGQGTIFVPAAAAQQFSRGGVNDRYEQTRSNKLFESYLNYTKDVSVLKSRIDLTGGYSYQDVLTKSPAFPERRADTTIFKPAGIPFETQNTLISFFGRLNYNLLDRYLFTATFRRDGSSRFGPENRWGNFPSAAFAWNIKSEDFLRDASGLSNLKLRIGWGITGQQEGIGDYEWQPNIFYGDSAARYQFGNSFYTVARPSGYDPNRKWEETEARNIGLDIGFANNRVGITMDYYDRDTRDLLAEVQVPAGTNFTNRIVQNIGDVKSSGFELGLNLVPVRNSDFNLDLNYNLTYLIDKEITRLQLVNDPAYLGAHVGGTGFNTVQINSVGYMPNTFFLYKQVYDQNGKPLEGIYVDRNSDGKIDDFDKFWVQNPEPELYMGFSANAAYKQIAAGFTMRSSIGNYMYNGIKAGAGIHQNVFTGRSFLSNAHRDILYTGFRTRQSWSDYYLENASFLRMDNLYVNYTVGKVMQGRANLRLSANVNNVFVVTKYSGLDPEISGGIDNSIYPRPRTYALGVNLDF